MALCAQSGIHLAVPRGTSPYIICDTGETPRRVDAYNEKSVDMARDVIPAVTPTCPLTPTVGVKGPMGIR